MGPPLGRRRSFLRKRSAPRGVNPRGALLTYAVELLLPVRDHHDGKPASSLRNVDEANLYSLQALRIVQERQLQPPRGACIVEGAPLEAVRRALVVVERRDLESLEIAIIDIDEPP